MAIQRESQAVSFRGQDTSSIKQVQVSGGPLRPDYVVEVGDQSWKDKLVTGILSDVQRVALKAQDIELENRYLEGAAKAGQIASEEEIEGNPLTRDWAVAGYRDTLGKMSIAQAEAKFAVDLKELRKQPPEKLQEYLAQRRAQLTPHLNSLSREQRTAMFGKLLVNDQAAITRHTAEHQAYIIDEKSKGIRSEFLPSLQQLTEARMKAATGGSQEVHTAALRASASVVVGNIWEDPTLPDEVKQKLTVEAMQHALSTDNIALYEFFANEGIPTSDGKRTPLLARLSGEEAVKLGNQYREARGRTVAARNMQDIFQAASLQSAMENNSYNLTTDEATTFTSRMVAKGVWNDSEATGFLKRHADYYAKNQNLHIAATAAMTGDSQWFASAGKSAEYGLDAIAKTLKDQPAAARISSYIQAGRTFPEAFKRAGAEFAPAFAQIMNGDGTINEQHAQTFRHMLSTIDAVEGEGKTATRIGIMSGMGEAQTLRFERVWSRMRGANALSEATAFAEVAKLEEAEAAMSLSKKAGIASTKDDKKAIADASQGLGLLREFGLNISKMWNSTDAARLEIAPEDRWFTNRNVASKYSEKLRAELAAEVAHVRLQAPSESSESAVSVAAANIAARTIKTEHGPLFLPRGSNPRAYFGTVDSQGGAVANVSNALYGEAISRMLQPTVPDGRFVLDAMQGRIRASERNADGTEVRAFWLDPKEVSQGVTDVRNKQSVRASEVFGVGKLVQGDGVSIRYNGENAAAVDPELMLKLRDNLYKNEGLKATPYDDLSGKLGPDGKPIKTVGIGVSSHNPHYPQPGPDGKVSPEAIAKSFSGASSDAAAGAVRVQEATGLRSDDWFLLFGEFSYQSGVGFLKHAKYKELVQAAQAGKAPEAMKALEQTPAYKMSAPARRVHYANLLRKALKV